MKVYPFHHARAMRPRACAGCGERSPKSAPSHWRYCTRCYGFASFRRAIEALREVRP